MEAIVTTALTKRFGDLLAVDRLDLSVPGGSIFGFLGPNGAGKTTTIRMLLGLAAPTSGAAHVLNRSIMTQSSAIRERSGVLLEHPGLYERLSAYDNLRYFADIYHLSEAEGDRRIKDLLERTGLWPRRHERVGGWSKGMKQKLAVARALVHNPELVFLDEPTSGLDPAGAAALRCDLLTLVKETGKTVFLTTHNLEEAERTCDYVGVIERGRLLAFGRPADLRLRFTRPQVAITGSGITSELMGRLTQLPGVAAASLHGNRLLIDLANPSASPEVVRLLVLGGADIDEVRKEQASLEQVYLALTGGEGNA